MEEQLPKRKVGVNDPCPCKSGKKYKKCCQLAEVQRQRAAQERLESALDALKDRPIEDEWLQRLNTYFLDRYGLQSSDVSSLSTSRELNRMHQNSGKQVLLLRRNDINESIFSSKEADGDVMVIYRNNYQAFHYETEYDNALKEIHKWM